MKFEFGEKVRVKATILRMKGPNSARYWEKLEDTNFEAIFLGYRRLSDGHVDYEYDDYTDKQYTSGFTTTKAHKGALVCREGFNPIKVFLEHIEPICCGQVDSDGGVCNLKIDHKEDHNFR